MITNTGRTIIAKYLLGYAPSYASHIAIGCGSKPLLSTDSVPDSSEKTELDFEMFRVPVTSRGFVTESDGVSRVVLTAELPSDDQKYEITEVGIYSAAYNQTAGSAGSKMLVTFSDQESWTSYNGSSYSDLQTQTSISDDSGLIITNTDKIIKLLSNNPIFNQNAAGTNKRATRYEKPRVHNYNYMLRGDSSLLTTSGGRFTISNGANYIEKKNVSIDLSKNSSTDELRIGLVLVNKDGSDNLVPDSAKVLIEFSKNGESSTNARVEATLTKEEYGWATNRYSVLSVPLSSIKMSSGFSWKSVNTIRIYSSVNDGLSSNFYVLFDAIRLENTTSVNALYGMTGYSVIQNATGSPVTKEPNTTNFVEFRFGIGVA